MLAPPWALIAFGVLLGGVLVVARAPGTWLATLASPLDKQQTRSILVAAPRGMAAGVLAMAKIVRYCALLVGLLVAVTTVGVRLDALLAASTVVLVGIGLGLQGIAQDFVSGVILLRERPVARGDFVQIGRRLVPSPTWGCARPESSPVTK